MTCHECLGDGFIDIGDQWVEGSRGGGYVAQVVKCEECDGTGEVECESSTSSPE